MDSAPPTRKKAVQWWHRLKGEDLITLQPLRTLRLEPFELRSDDTHMTYFNALTLAQYLIASKNFHHPSSRRPITRDECAKLSEHLARVHKNKKQGEALLTAYDERMEELRMQALPRTAQNAILASELQRSIFGLGAPADTDSEAEAAGTRGRARGRGERRRGDGGRGGRSGRGARGARGDVVAQANLDGGPEHSGVARLSLARTAAPSVLIDGNLAVIDDDEVPGQLSGTAATRAHSRDVAVAAAAAAADPFPALPPAAPPRPAAPACRPVPQSARPAPAPQPPPPPDPLPSSSAELRRALASAFGRSTEAGSSFAADSARAFEKDTLALARAQPAFVAALEATLDAFVEGTKQTHELQPMPRQQRKAVHELARFYGITTIAKDNESRRFVKLYRTGNTDWPPLRLSDAAKASDSEAAAAAAGLGAAPSWTLTLTDVACSHAALRQSLSFLDGEYTWEWPRVREGTPPTVTVHLATEALWRRARETLGGGVRGAFRVGAHSRPPQHTAQISATDASSAVAAPSAQLFGSDANTSCSSVANGPLLGGLNGHAPGALVTSAGDARHGMRGRSLAELAASGVEPGLSRESAAIWRPSAFGRALGGSYSCDGVARSCATADISSQSAAPVKEIRQKKPPQAAAPEPLNTFNQWAALGGSDDGDSSGSETWSSVLDDLS